MNQYERIVSYIYQYHLEEKGANVGYAKLEKRGNQCRISVQMRTVSLKQLPKVYLYKQLQEGIQTILAGQMVLRGNSLLWKDSCEADKLFQSDWHIEDIDGIFIDGKDSVYFATSWKKDRFYKGNWNQKPEAAENTREDTRMPAPENESAAASKGDSGEKAVKMEESPEREKLSAKPADLQAEPLAVISNSQESKRDVQSSNRMETSKPAAIPDAVETSNAVIASNNAEKATAEKIADTEEISKIAAASNPFETSSVAMPSYSQGLSESREQPGKKEPDVNTAGQELQMQSICGVCPFKRKSFDYGKKILMTFPSMKPFQNGVARACVRMELQDIGCLPIASWSLSGNRFLLHGYYCYRHLLFAQLMDGRYVLGVPGIYSEKERRNAVKFGFTDFQSIGDFGMQQGVFGYWFLELPEGSPVNLA